MRVKVYSGQTLIEEHFFASEVAASAYADFWQDEGYKVRIDII